MAFYYKNACLNASIELQFPKYETDCLCLFSDLYLLISFFTEFQEGTKELFVKCCVIAKGSLQEKQNKRITCYALQKKGGKLFGDLIMLALSVC